MRLLPRRKAESQATLIERQAEMKATDAIEKVRKTRESVQQFIEESESQKKLIESNLEIFKKLKEKEKSDLLSEIKSLEEQKRTALEPLYALRSDLDGRKVHLDLREEFINRRESGFPARQEQIRADEKRILFQLAEIEGKRSELSERERRVIEDEEENKKVSEELDARREKMARDLRNESSQIEVEKVLVAGERDGLEKEKEWVEMMKKSFLEERIKIDSDKRLLQAAFDEGRKLGIV